MIFSKRNLLENLTPTFTRASRATQIDAVLGVVLVGNNVRRIDPIKGELLEEARTNLATYSDGDLLTYTFNTGVRDAATSIKGFDNSIEFYQSVVTAFAYKNIPTTAALDYTISVFVEMDDGNAPVYSATSASGDFCFILGNKIIDTPAYIEHIVDNIYRISVTKVSGGIGVYVGVAKYIPQSSRTFRIAGIQVEQSTFATSYIKTEASTVARANDNLTYELGIGNFPQELQVKMDIIPIADGGDYEHFRLFGTDDNTSYEVRTDIDTTSNFTYDGGGVIFTIDSDFITQGNEFDLMLSSTKEGSNIRGLIQRDSNSDFYGTVSGSLNHSDLGTLQIGRYNTEYTSGYYKNIKLYSKD